MNQITTTPTDFDVLASLVTKSFPNIRCLRCHHDEFYLTDKADLLNDFAIKIDNPSMPTGEPQSYSVLTLACTRCGHLEHHLKAVLSQAAKPIVIEEPE